MSVNFFSIAPWGTDMRPYFPQLRADGQSPFIELHETDTNAQVFLAQLYWCDMEGKRIQANLAEVRFAVTVTDARIALASNDFAKGSKWVGFGSVGVVVALVATGVSNNRARKAAEGQGVASHVPYPSLLRVGYRFRKSTMVPECLRLVLLTAGGRLSLELMPCWQANVADKIARDVLRRAITFRLRHEMGMHPAVRQDLERTLSADPAPGTSETEHYSYWDIPHPSPVELLYAANQPPGQ